MFTAAAWMNWRSVAEHVCPVAGFARPLVASVSARAHRATRPAAVRPRRRTLRLSSVDLCRSTPVLGFFRQKISERYEIVRRIPIAS